MRRISIVQQINKLTGDKTMNDCILVILNKLMAVSVSDLAPEWDV